MTPEDVTPEENSQRNSEEKKHQLERIAMIVAAAVVGGSIWYWTGQVQNVLEILEMAYG